MGIHWKTEELIFDRSGHMSIKIGRRGRENGNKCKVVDLAASGAKFLPECK